MNYQQLGTTVRHPTYNSTYGYVIQDPKTKRIYLWGACGVTNCCGAAEVVDPGVLTLEKLIFFLTAIPKGILVRRGRPKDSFDVGDEKITPIVQQFNDKYGKWCTMSVDLLDGFSQMFVVDLRDAQGWELFKDGKR